MNNIIYKTISTVYYAQQIPCKNKKVNKTIYKEGFDQ